MAHVANDPEARLSAPPPAGSPKKQAQSPAQAGRLARIDSPDSHAAAPEQRRFGRVAVAAIILFWVVQFAWFSLDRLLRAPDAEGLVNLAARSLVTTAGVLISLVILKVLQRSTGASFLKRALLAMALALVGATVNSIVNMLVFAAVLGPVAGESLSPIMVAEDLGRLVYFFSWFYLALALILLSLTYGEELLHRERRIAELRGDADRARLAALRYQLNPHFLFNALNSAAGLVATERNREAELMLENLADFLRATLELDAAGEITLRDELALQSLYLEVEKVRFPNRLRVEQDVPADLQDALVPNLLTQPLIENVIKHAVAQSTRPVCLTISAREADGMLHIEIRDDGGDARSRAATAGASIGLQNVARRLDLHFGEEASFDAGAADDSGFVARISMPVRRAP